MSDIDRLEHYRITAENNAFRAAQLVTKLRDVTADRERLIISLRHAEARIEQLEEKLREVSVNGTVA